MKNGEAIPGTMYRFGGYICEIEELNQDEPTESIVTIYNSFEEYKLGEYIERVSLDNKNIKSNIEEYMIINYDIKKITRISLLEEVKDMIFHNIVCYSADYLMNNAKPEYSKEWNNEWEKYRVVQEMIKEERNKEKQKIKSNIYREER